MNIKNGSRSLVAFLILAVGTSCSPVNVKHQISSPPPKAVNNFLTPLRALPQLPVSDVYQDITFSPDNKTLAISTEKTRHGFETRYEDVLFNVERLQLWNLQTGKRAIPELRQNDVLAFSFSPDGRYIVTESREGLNRNKSKMQLWNLRSGKLIWSKSINDGKQIIQFSPDGNCIVSASKSAFIWQVKTGKILHNLNLHAVDGESIGTIIFSPKGDVVALDFGARILLLDTKSWRIDTQQMLKGGVELTRNLAFSPDGKLLAATAFYGDFGLSATGVWDVKKRKLLRSYTANHAGIVPHGGRSLGFSPDGKTVIVNLYTLDINKPHSTFQPIFKSYRDVLALSSRRMLAVTKIPGGDWVELWDIKRKILKQRWKASYPSIPYYDRAAFSPDGSMLATVKSINDNGREVVQLWHVRGLDISHAK